LSANVAFPDSSNLALPYHVRDLISADVLSLGAALTKSNPFKWRHYESEIILLCVRWYLLYALSYRDLEEMMIERGLAVDHTTIYRWVQSYAPELEKRIRPHLRLTNDSYRVDETYIKIKGNSKVFSFTFARPKSSTLTYPSRRSITLSGLMSR
jgi:hypothetical protein